MNIGLFGGTFDPPHIGHLVLAEYACSELRLDTIYFIPNYISPFKKMNASQIQQSVPHAEASTRCELVELAIVGNKKFHAEYSEARRKDVSYTVDTVRLFAERFPDDMLFIIMGADAFQDFHLWKEPDAIVQLASVAVAKRPGVELQLDVHPYGKFVKEFPIPQIDISSTEIRERIRQGKSIQYLVPWTVQTCIEAERLYR